MRVQWECAWCQCQILVLAPAYPTLHKYAHSASERSCVSTGNVRGASAKYWYQHQRIQHYTNTPTALQKLHVCPLGMCVVLVPNIGISTSISNTTQIRQQQLRNFMCFHWECAQVLVPNIGISTSISNTTQIRPQHFRKVMCVHWECAWCQCRILVLAPAYPTLHKYAHSTSETLCVSTGNVRGASAKYWYQHQHIQHYTSTPTALQKLHVFLLGMCVVLVPNIGISTSISNTTQIRPQHFRKVMCVHLECARCQCRILVLAPAYPTLHKYAHSTSETLCVHWECAWCQCQILVLAPAYPTLHKYAHSTSETSCVSTGNVRGASAKYWYQHQHIQHYTNTPTVVKKLHVCPLGMCVVLVPNIGISTSISNTTQIRPQHFRNFMCKLGMCVVLVPNIGISTSISNTTQIRPQRFRKVMCVHWECAWCQCQILVLAPAYPTLHKYAHSTSETLCVSAGNVCGASAKYWYQHQHIQHYTNTPTVVKKLYVFPLGMCVGASAKYWYQHQHIQHYTNTPTALQKGHVCPLGMCVVLVPNIGISTSISNTTQIRPQHFRNFMCVHWECAWCQCQILVLAPAYPTLHKYAHSTSETSCFSTGNVRGASAKYWYQHQHIQHYTNTPTALQKGHVCPLGMCVVLVPNIGISTSISNTTQIRPQHFRNFMCPLGMCVVLVPNIGIRPAYPTLHKYAHSTSETSCVSTGNVRGASAKYWYQHQHIQHYTNTPTVVKKLHVCPLGMCVVLVPNICISTSISNTTQIRPQHFRNFMCPLGMCVVLVPNIGISTSISNTTQVKPQHFRKVMCVHWECAWCQCQILVLIPAYPILHKYAHSTSETSCVSTGNVRGASAKYWYQHQHIQHYTNTSTVLQKGHVCPLGMCVVLVPNISISTSISNTTQIRPQHL